MRRSEGLAVADERQRSCDRPRVSRLRHCSQCKRVPPGASEHRLLTPAEFASWSSVERS
jgi:hypothetical protein